MIPRLFQFISLSLVVSFAALAVAHSQQPTPFKFLQTKAEQGGRDVMELYAYAGKFDPAALKAFCLDRKSKSTAKAFYYAVIFDSAANAKFPSSPFTAEYGIEENTLKHIRAIYVYNRVNGFSELRYHDANIWDHSPTREKL